MEWVIGEAEKKHASNKDTAGEGDAPAKFSEAACTVFDYLKERMARKRGLILSTLVFARRKELVQPNTLPRMVGQCYKWASRLVRYCIQRRLLDTRPFEMWTVFGTVTGKPETRMWTGVCLPSLSSRQILQDGYFRNMSDPPSDFAVFAYIFALTHLVHIKFKFPRKRKGAESNLINPFAYVSRAVAGIVRGWSAFARSLGFCSVDEMVFPYFCIERSTGKILLLPDSSRLLPGEFKYHIKIVDKAQFASAVGAVARKCGAHATDGGVGTVRTAIGVARDSEAVQPPFENVSGEAHAHIRTFTVDFFADICSYTSNELLYIGGSLEDIPELATFRAVGDNPVPPRFSYNEQVIDIVRRSVNSARILSLQGGNSPARPRSLPEQSRRGESTYAYHEVGWVPCPSEMHTCSAGCDCKGLRVKLLQAMSKHCATVVGDFKHFLQHLDDQWEIHKMDKAVQFILTDPPYNIRREKDRKNSAHDRLLSEEYKMFADLAYRVLKPGGHLVLFCSISQFQDWHEIFAKYSTGKDSERPFQVTSVPLVFVPEQNVYPQKPFRRSLLHCNVVEFGLHVVRTPTNFNAAFDQVQWESHGYVHSTFPAHTNVVNSVPGLAAGERLFVNSSNASSNEQSSTFRSRYRLRPEQKSVALCRELVSRYSRPGDIVMDPFAGTFTTAEACLTLSNPRRFVGGDVDEDCVFHGEKRCLRAFLHVIKRKGSHPPFQLSDEIMQCATMYYSRHFADLDAKVDGSNALQVPHEGLPLAQALPNTTLNLISNLCQNPDFVKPPHCSSAPDMWPRSLYAELMSIDPDILHAAECSYLYLVRKGPCTLAALRTFNQGDFLGYYHGTLVYVNMNGTGRRTYGHGMHKVTMQKFRSYAVSILRTNDAVFYKKHRVVIAYVVPAAFCPFSTTTLAADVGQANAELVVQGKRAYEVSEIVRPEHVSVRATKKIGPGTEIVLCGQVRFN